MVCLCMSENARQEQREGSRVPYLAIIRCCPLQRLLRQGRAIIPFCTPLTGQGHCGLVSECIDSKCCCLGLHLLEVGAAGDGWHGMARGARGSDDHVTLVKGPPYPIYISS
jgi:hypothetical protein